MLVTECPDCGWQELELRLGGGEAKYFCPKCGRTGDCLQGGK